MKFVPFRPPRSDLSLSSRAFSEAAPVNGTWVSTAFVRSPQTKLRLFCFPYAGGGASVYRTWQKEFPSPIEVCPLQLPGREMRLKEEGIRDFPSMLEQICNALDAFVVEPYALFGHSMGAFLAYEVAHELIRQGNRPPAHIFVSGHQAPQVASKLLSKSVYTMSDEDLINEVSALDGPAFISTLQDPGFRKLVLRTLRADLEVCQSYQDCRPTHSLLNVDMSALGGIDDFTVRFEDLKRWREIVAGCFSTHLIQGDHFFVVNRAREVIKIVRDVLIRAI
jgi:medium-chain acyl-[acyl-carrier-protein] hydrolase